mmetsp:Transcript_9028/g.19593  ORF Transcript_9028/g.19593 Transcript_9028/m.19593 type:complete len:222 (-) Transcript_9028:781-1446(-)
MTPMVSTPSATSQRSISRANVEPEVAPVASTNSSKRGGDVQCREFEERGKTHEGRIKSYSQTKGFGFIVSPEFKRDIFVRHADIVGVDCVEVSLCAGRRVSFQLRKSQDKLQARAVQYLPAPSQRFVGTLKTLGDKYGFVDCSETRTLYGLDVWVAPEHLPAELETDALRTISFNVVHNEKGQPQAKDVRCEPTTDDISFESEASGYSVMSTSTYGRVNRW